MFDKIEHFEAYDKLLKLATTMSGINFALAMRNEAGEIKVYPRENQPCQGGEMRKYGESHPGDCTRPNDRRPTDLRKPFPDGIPEAVAVNLLAGWTSPSDKLDVLIKGLYSDDSPYQRGFGSATDVEYVMKNDHIHGLIFWNTEVDPTVFVNSLQFLNTFKGQPETYVDLVEAGLTTTEAIACMVMCNIHPFKQGIGPASTYYFTASPSIWRLLEKKPHDLSGGTLRDRFDYNRPKVQALFSAGEGEHSISWPKALKEQGLQLNEELEADNGRGGKYRYNNTKKQEPEEFVEAARKVFAAALEASKDEDREKVYPIDGLDLNRGCKPDGSKPERQEYYNYEIGQAGKKPRAPAKPGYQPACGYAGCNTCELVPIPGYKAEATPAPVIEEGHIHTSIYPPEFKMAASAKQEIAKKVAKLKAAPKSAKKGKIANV